VSDLIEGKIEAFLGRWNEIHKIVTVKATAGRKYDPTLDDMDRIPPGKIERIGICLVYPSPNFEAWYDVKTPDGMIIGFAGELAHRNAVQWAKDWDKKQ
jgi:hypothetical protein